jgi:lipoate-protein ligase A
MNTIDERTWDYLMNIDPDELVDVLQISSQELLEAFPEKVHAYVTEEHEDVEDDEEEGYYD